MSAFKYFMKIDLGLLPGPSTVSVTRREVKACVATYFWFVLLPTINGRPLTGGTNMDSTVSRHSNYASFLILHQITTFQTGNFQWCVTFQKLISCCCVTDKLAPKVDGHCCLSPLMYKAKAYCAETSLVVTDGKGNRNSSPTFLFSVLGHPGYHMYQRIWTPHVGEEQQR